MRDVVVRCVRVIKYSIHRVFSADFTVFRVLNIELFSIFNLIEDARLSTGNLETGCYGVEALIPCVLFWLCINALLSRVFPATIEFF